jgi:hypothetical protein
MIVGQRAIPIGPMRDITAAYNENRRREEEALERDAEGGIRRPTTGAGTRAMTGPIRR